LQCKLEPGGREKEGGDGEGTPLRFGGGDVAVYQALGLSGDVGAPTC
jgi:hypothetical protein